MGEKGNIVEAGAASLGDRARDVAVDVVSTTTDAAKGIAVGMATARVQERLVGDDDTGVADDDADSGDDAEDQR